MLNIKVVGGGCPNCQKLAQLCQEVLTDNQIAADIEKITDHDKFADLGVFMTPGLILNDTVVSSGKIPSKENLKTWITEASI
ncbi:MAG: thioredoxin family protein [Candidatus Marinimicrobia bacterium]|nr:thioredoxin family protein [Candidatus Neomarinimicrobiota bacterium]